MSITHLSVEPAILYLGTPVVPCQLHKRRWLVQSRADVIGVLA